MHTGTLELTMARKGYPVAGNLCPTAPVSPLVRSAVEDAVEPIARWYPGAVRGVGFRAAYRAQGFDSNVGCATPNLRLCTQLMSHHRAKYRAPRMPIDSHSTAGGSRLLRPR